MDYIKKKQIRVRSFWSPGKPNISYLRNDTVPIQFWLKRLLASSNISSSSSSDPKHQSRQVSALGNIKHSAFKFSPKPRDLILFGSDLSAMEEKKTESTNKNVKKANLLDHHSIKHILDESVSDVRTVDDLSIIPWSVNFWSSFCPFFDA